MRYLTPRALEGLKEYRYKPGGYTVLDALHQPIWNCTFHCVEVNTAALICLLMSPLITDITEKFLPAWLAPNLITLTGLLVLVSAYIVTARYAPDFEAGLPRWIFLMNAAASFFYLHADCLDGKQARRTRTSSPLGQLFDHGCDALAVHFILTALIVSLGMRAPPHWITIGNLFIVFIPWLTAHWEEYHTGVMLYGNGAWGVTEANYAVVSLHVVSGILGPDIWNLAPLSLPLNAVAEHFAIPVEWTKFLHLAAELKLKYYLLGFLAFMGYGLLSSQIKRVFAISGHPALLKEALPKEERGSKQLGTGAAAYHLFQLGLMHSLGLAMLLQQSIHEALPGQTRIAIATYGVTYALQATRLIMAHMAKEPFEVAIWPLALLAMQAVNLRLNLLDTATVGYVVNMLVVAGYLHYVVSVINEVCEFLDINALTIKHKKKREVRRSPRNHGKR